MVVVVLLSLAINNVLSGAHRSVLGYATDMSIGSLLTDTNGQRTANGQTALSLNSLLNQAAQAKANDMASRDYWSHNTPDGQTPWTFITATGYSYQTAGENLAYGFTTAAATVDGWMNSPGHRANILNVAYREVGFGIVDIANYQSSGPQTLIVAMYAAPRATTPVTTPPTPAATVPPKSATGAAGGSPLTTAEPAPASASPAEPAALPTPATPKSDIPATVAKTATKDTSQRIARLQLVSSSRNASWSLMAITFMSVGALAFVFLRHGIAWHKVIRRGERFVLHHPLLDIAALIVLGTGFILVQSAGFIR